MIRRLSSGIDGLDMLVEGGLPDGSSTLLYGPPGSEKHVFCLQFIAEGLRLGDGGIMVISNETVNEARASFGEVGSDITQLTSDQAHKLRFVDCYSWRTSEIPYPEVIEDVVRSSMDLNHIAMAISTAAERLAGGHIRVTVDLLSSLLMSAPPQSVYRLASLITARLKESSSTALFILEEGMHDQQTVASLQQLLDCVILFRNTEKKGFMRKEICVAKMKRTHFESKWLPISRDPKTGRIGIEQSRSKQV